MKPEEERREEMGIEEVGRKGGAAAMAGAPAMEHAEAVTWARDLVRWGPIWAGLLIAIGIQLILGTLGLAIALGIYDVTAPNFGELVTSLLGIWSAISALIALFVGGYIAGRMAAVLGLRNGLVQGSVVWALALVAGILLGAAGVAGVLGSLANLGPVFTRGMADIGTPEAQAAVRATSSGAWWFVIGAVLAWAAAAGGGVLGASAHREAVERH